MPLVAIPVAHVVALQRDAGGKCGAVGRVLARCPQVADLYAIDDTDAGFEVGEPEVPIRGQGVAVPSKGLTNGRKRASIQAWIGDQGPAAEALAWRLHEDATLPSFIVVGDHDIDPFVEAGTEALAKRLRELGLAKVVTVLIRDARERESNVDRLPGAAGRRTGHR